MQMEGWSVLAGLGWFLRSDADAGMLTMLVHLKRLHIEAVEEHGK